MHVKTVLISAVAVAGLAACGGSSKPAAESGPAAAATTTTSATSQVPTPADSGSSVTVSATSTATAGGSGGSCSSYTGGKGGVIRTFCDGSAKAVVTVAGASSGSGGTLSGGDCAQSGGYFAVNIGVVTGQDYSGKKPDYVGTDLPDKVGPFTKAFFTADFDGAAHLVTGAAGTVNPGFSGFTASGKDLQGNTVSIQVTC
jgi:hypothetical protein